MNLPALKPGRAAILGGAGFKAPAPPKTIVLAAAAVLVIVLAPFAVTILNAVHGSLETTLRLLFRPITGHLLLNTLGLAFASTTVCALIGTGAAWLVERTDLPGRRFWAIAAPLPLAIPAFIASYAWLSTSTIFEGAAGALLVVSASYYPLVYLPVAAALRNVDPALEESARTMGCSPWHCFFRVTLPQIKPALLGGMLLVILHVLTEFGAFALLRFRTFTTAIYAEYTAGFAADQGALLACVLLVLCLLILVGESFLRGRRDYARIGSGTRRAAARYPLGSARYPTLLVMLALGTVTLGVPLGLIAYWLTQHDVAAVATAGVSPGLLLGATWHSLGYGFAAGIATTLVALPIAWLSVRYRHPLVHLMERASFLPRGMPGIVLALALVTLSLTLLRPLYQTAVLLVAGYAIIFIPLAVVSLRATLAQVQPDLEQSARALGHRPIAVLRRVILPLAAPGIGAAMALVFIAVVTELTTTLLLIPTGAQTLATQVWAASSTFAFAAAAPYAAILVVVSMLATWILANRFGRAPIDME
ncbi:MAG: ABC transporter permease [Gammaproteobacteria bacterium]